MKKLNNLEEGLENMINAFESFGDKLELILFQLPSNWNFNEDRLRHFLDLLPDNFKYAFEFRDESWINDTVFSMLEENNFVFCMYDLAGYQSPLEITADFAYMRLHGPSD